MNAHLRLLAASLCSALLVLSSAAAAAPVPATTNASGTASILQSLSILKQTDLDFGEVITTGAGTVVMDPTTGALTTTGGLTVVGTSAHVATFTATGSKNSVVNIRLPSSAVTLARVGGGGTLTIDNFTTDGKTNRKFPLNSAFNFNVAATLNVGAAQPDGVYTGTFPITVQYP